MKKSFFLAWLHVQRKWGTSLVAVLAIALSLFCGSTLYKLNLLSHSRLHSLDRGFDAVVGAKSGGLEILLGSLNGEGTLPDYVPYKLFLSLQAKTPVHFEDGANSDPQFIESITPLVYFGRTLAPDGFKVLATDLSFWNSSGHTWIFSEGSSPGNEGEVVLGSEFARKLGSRVGDKITAEAWLPKGIEQKLNFPLNVVGILRPTGLFWDSVGFTNLQSAQKIFQSLPRLAKSWGPDVLHYFLIRLRPNGWTALETLINERTVTQAIRVESETQKLETLLGSGEQISWGTQLFILFLAGLTVTATMTFRFQSLNSQVAILRALGSSQWEIRFWLLWESLIIGGFSVLLGATLETLIFPPILQSLEIAMPLLRSQPLSSWASAPIWFMTLFVTILIGCLASFWLEKKSILNSLREL